MSRRGKNEGHIRLRQDGRWEAILHLGFEGGKRHPKHFYGKTRAEVRDKLIKAQRELQLGIKPTDDSVTVKQYLEDWLKNSAKQSIRPATYARYEGLVKLHITPKLGNIRLAKLEARQVQAFLNGKLAEGLSPRTVQYIRAVLHRALNQALRWELVGRNVVSLVPSPKVEQHEIQLLTVEEAKHFLETIKGDRLEALYAIAMAIGLRQGEALGLQWANVDFDTKVVRVQTNLQRNTDGEFELLPVKTKRSRRSIPLPDVAIAKLRSHKARQAEERLLSGPNWKDKWGLVFTTKTGAPLDASNVTHHFQDLLAEAGLPRQRFHDLRHWCASMLIAQSVHPRVIMGILGHSQISITMDLYGHLMPEVLENAADLMNSVLSESTR